AARGRARGPRPGCLRHLHETPRPYAGKGPERGVIPAPGSATARAAKKLESVRAAGGPLSGLAGRRVQYDPLPGSIGATSWFAGARAKLAGDVAHDGERLL